MPMPRQCEYSDPTRQSDLSIAAEFRFQVKVQVFVVCGLSVRTTTTQQQQQVVEMATASILQWVPDSLYNLSVCVTVCNYHIYRAEVKSLPDSVQFDVLYKVRQF